MSKKKMILALVITGILMLALASPALAVSYTHGNFSATTDACAGCHVTHYAQAAKLLKDGPTQTEFCYLCHGSGGPGAPYDAQDGQIGGTDESSAGGFDKIGLVAITSRHNVDGYTDNSTAFVDENTSAGFTGNIPGGTGSVSGNGLVCSSCHDPHAGGGTPANPRLLRTTLMGVSSLAVTVATTNVGIPDGNSYQATKVSGYKTGFVAWCGACHDKFKTTQGSGHTLGTDTMYRHAMDVSATIPEATGGAAKDVTTGAGIPLQAASPGSGTGEVTCLTCHRSHGSSAQMTGYAVGYSRWVDTDSDGVIDAGETSNQTTSALLRMDSRGVCYTCHDAATANKPV